MCFVFLTDDPAITLVAARLAEIVANSQSSEQDGFKTLPRSLSLEVDGGWDSEDGPEDVDGKGSNFSLFLSLPPSITSVFRKPLSVLNFLHKPVKYLVTYSQFPPTHTPHNFQSM